MGSVSTGVGGQHNANRQGIWHSSHGSGSSDPFSYGVGADANSTAGGQPAGGLRDSTAGQSLHLAGQPRGSTMFDPERSRLQAHTGRSSEARERGPGRGDLGNSRPLSSSGDARQAGNLRSQSVGQQQPGLQLLP